MSALKALVWQGPEFSCCPRAGAIRQRRRGLRGHPAAGRLAVPGHHPGMSRWGMRMVPGRGGLASPVLGVALVTRGPVVRVWKGVESSSR